MAPRFVRVHCSLLRVSNRTAVRTAWPLRWGPQRFGCHQHSWTCSLGAQLGGVFADRSSAYHRPMGSTAKFTLGSVAKLFGYTLYPLKRGLRAVRK